MIISCVFVAAVAVVVVVVAAAPRRHVCYYHNVVLTGVQWVMLRVRLLKLWCFVCRCVGFRARTSRWYYYDVTSGVKR
jgi:hypothetical protein